MTTLDEIETAYRAIAAAEEAYRATLRAGLAAGVTLVSVASRLKRSDEKLRQDAMPEEKRAALRATARERQAGIRAAARQQNQTVS